MRVPVQPRVLRWAVDRAGIGESNVRVRFAKYDEWLAGASQPTLKQLQDFARCTYAAIGYFFQSEPPELTLPIPDFRTRSGAHPDEPSPDLLDTIYLCQQRQDWYIGYARANGGEPLPFVATLTIQSDISQAATAIREALRFDLLARRRLPTWEDALRQLIHLAETAGVLVMVSGVVGSNNSRKLEVNEFRGFALSDPLAPLIFINGSDTKSAQMFTLVHELAHVWLGQSALSDSTTARVDGRDVEQWCNQVAAEVLVPIDVFRTDYRLGTEVGSEMQRLAKLFKVSTLVVLRRMFDAGGFSRDQFWQLYEAEVTRLSALMRAKKKGGDYYRTTMSRVSHRFTRAIVISALEGQSTFSEAFRLLGCKKIATFAELGHHVGIDVEGSVG